MSPLDVCKHNVLVAQPCRACAAEKPRAQARGTFNLDSFNVRIEQTDATREQKMPKVGQRGVYEELRRRGLSSRMMDEREAKGIATYGRSLETHNGRDPHVDLVQEQLDALAYAEQARMERDDLVARVLVLEAWIEEHSHDDDQCAGVTTAGRRCISDWPGRPHSSDCSLVALLGREPRHP